MKKSAALDSQQSLTFDYYTNLESIVKDLENINRLTPAEISRYGCLFDSKTQGEEAAIVEARKSDLLSYIQTICRDHILWSKKLLAKGWTKDDAAKEAKKSRKGKGYRNGVII